MYLFILVSLLLLVLDVNMMVGIPAAIFRPRVSDDDEAFTLVPMIRQNILHEREINLTVNKLKPSSWVLVTCSQY